MPRQVYFNDRDYENEYWKRLLTFKQWDNPIVNKFSLASVGFSFTGTGDKVQCQFCHGRLYNWVAGDDPYTEHKKHFPKCPLILQLEQDNTNPVEPKYNSLKSRIDTFLQKTNERTPNELATAGFFCAGTANIVRCFHCGLTLKDWEKEDDPFRIHGVFSPACVFIRNRSAFQSLGITLCNGLGPEVMDQLRKQAEAALVNSPAKQDLIDNISPDSLLFQQLLQQYDKATIVREMIVMIQRHGRNFESGEEFVSYVTQRHVMLSQMAKSNKRSDELKAENDRLRAEKRCQMCGDSKISIVFLPCGHLVSCVRCADTSPDCFKCHKSWKSTDS